jgi:c-di-GMP-binding flagellar brake protein YcgR
LSNEGPETGSERPRDFVLVKSQSAIEKYLAEALDLLASTVIWTQDQVHLIQSYVKGIQLEDLTFSTYLPQTIDPDTFRASLDQQSKTRTNVQNEFLFSLSLLSSNIFFKCVFKEIVNKELHFYFPKQVYKLQRREFVRTPIFDQIKLNVRFKNPELNNPVIKPLFEKKVLPTVQKLMLDLSGGGLSFEITDLERPFYTKGQIIEDMSFSVKDRSYLLTAEIRHIKKTETKKTGVFTNKVGCKFTGINQADQDLIVSFVFDESRKFYSQFIK